jgi:dihydrofolate reductase
MIRCIAALDSKNGIADDHGIPWHGKLPTDVAYYRDKLQSGTILMGYGVYKELSKPYPGSINYVATSHPATALMDGFEVVSDASTFLRNTHGDIWNVGGAGLFTSTIAFADELYLTRIEADFHCTKFFPEFESSFVRASHSESHTENGLSFCFEVWKRKP